MPFTVMCAVRFLMGILGMNSANIRISAVQSHVPYNLRAKVNALFFVLVSVMSMLGQIFAGALGEILPYWLIQLSFQATYFISVIVFALPKRNKVRELYNFSSSEAEPGEVC